MDARPDGDRAVKLAVVEVLDRDDHARLAVPVWHWPVTIGRAIDCDVVLDDVHAAARHVSVSDGDGALSLLVGETVNGVQLRHRRLAALQSADLFPGEVFQIGATRLRVRRASDVLSPERPLVPDPVASRVPILVLVLALTAWNAGEHWLNTDPGGRLTDYLPVLLGMPLGLAVWSGLWAVGSKLVRHRFDFRPHARIALGYSLIASVTGLVLPLAAFSLGWAFPSRVSGLAASGVAWAMVLAHLALILPSRRRLLSGVMGAIFVAGVSLFLVRNYQVHDRVFGELYVTTLAPPALRLAPTVATTRFIDEARDLKSALDAHVQDEDTDDQDDRVSENAPDVEPAPLPANAGHRLPRRH
jgi:hypothetical protein